MKRLFLYIIGGFPTIAISYRPLRQFSIRTKAPHELLYTEKRVYYNLTGSTVIRFFQTPHTIHTHLDKNTGLEILTLVLKEGA